MKKTRIIGFIMVLAVILFGGFFTKAEAAVTSTPEAVVSDSLREVEYIKNFPVIVKTTDNGKYYVYCMNMSATYGSGVKFTKTGKVDQGFVYIINNRPQTGDADRDFYVTQMAVWYYEDYLNQNNFNLEEVVKKYIVGNMDKDQVAKDIYDLYYGAKYYKESIGTLKLEADGTQFTLEDGYYVSSEIKVVTDNLVGKLSYSLTNTPAGSKIVKSGENGIKVKIPADTIPEGQQLTFTVDVKGNYNTYEGYYYYNSPKYQKVLFQDSIVINNEVSDSVKMILRHYPTSYDVNIDKMDVTESKEIPGATLVVKDEAGNVVESWVSTTESHKIKLNVGKYSLTETIAPEGYKLSTTTINFLVDAKGGIYVMNANGQYVSVDKVVMINELKDVVSIAKKDSKTDKYVSGAVLAIKDVNGNVVREFTTSDTVYQLSLDAGKYTLAEVSAPAGYILSNEVVSFELLNNGTLRVMNDKGEYVDSVIVTFYNTPETVQEVPVPATGKNATIALVSGIALLIGGIACVKKTIKEC